MFQVLLTSVLKAKPQRLSSPSDAVYKTRQQKGPSPKLAAFCGTRSYCSVSELLEQQTDVQGTTAQHWSKTWPMKSWWRISLIQSDFAQAVHQERTDVLELSTLPGASQPLHRTSATTIPSRNCSTIEVYSYQLDGILGQARLTECH